MEQSKQAIKDFMSKSGRHDTTVHEKVAPAVTHETVSPTRHENVQTAIDKEIHQEHYHTSAQPVLDREVLPEKHTHNLAAVEHRKFEHGSEDDTKRRLDTEAAQFRDERVVTDTQHTHSVAPVVAGEHIHHHVHETIQPVIQKETIQPNVVHTTVPIHEVHHNAAQHHSASALPAVSMEDFRKQGGVLTGREERIDGFEGEPRSVGGALSGDADGLTSHTNRGAEGLTGNTTHRGAEGLTGGNTLSRGAEGLTGNTTTRGAEGLTGNTTTRGAEGLTGSNTTGHSSGGGITGAAQRAAEGLTGGSSTTGHRTTNERAL